MTKVLMIVAPEKYRDEELEVPKAHFEDKGIEVAVASTKKGTCHGVSEHNALYSQNGNIGQKDTGSWQDLYTHEYVFNTIQQVTVGAGTHLVSDNGRTETSGITLHAMGWQIPTSYNKVGPVRHRDASGGNVAHIDTHVEFLVKEAVYWPQSLGSTLAEENAQKALFHPNQSP